MRILLGLILVFALTVPASLVPALAQKLPTAKEVGNIIFKEVENAPSRNSSERRRPTR